LPDKSTVNAREKVRRAEIRPGEFASHIEP
jgi:hypothetical protein